MGKPRVTVVDRAFGRSRTRLRWLAMTSPSGTSDAERGFVLARLGPSGAGRCRRRIHLDAALPEQREAPSAAALRAFDELSEYREQVFGAIRSTTGLPSPARPDDSPTGTNTGTGVVGWRIEPQPIVLSPKTVPAQRICWCGWVTAMFR